MEDKKRHHYVPETYLKRFAFERTKGQFFVHHIPLPALDAGAINLSKVRNVCVMNKLYTLPGVTTEQRMLVEDFYSDAYEKDYSHVYHKLVDKSVHTITNEDRRLIIGMVVSLFFRNPFWVNAHDKMMDDIFDRAFAMTIANGQDSFFLGEEEIAIKGKTLEQLKQERQQEDKPMVIIQQARAAIRLLKARLNSDTISVTTITNPDAEFITSDRPVQILNPDNRHIIPMDPLNFLSLPLDAKHRVDLIPGGHPAHLSELLRDSCHGIYDAFIYNTQQATQADKFLFGTERALQAIARQADKLRQPAAR